MNKMDAEYRRIGMIVISLLRHYDGDDLLNHLVDIILLERRRAAAAAIDATLGGAANG